MILNLLFYFIMNEKADKLTYIIINLSCLTFIIQHYTNKLSCTNLFKKSLITNMSLYKMAVVTMVAKQSCHQLNHQLLNLKVNARLGKLKVRLNMQRTNHCSLRCHMMRSTADLCQLLVIIAGMGGFLWLINYCKVCLQLIGQNYKWRHVALASVILLSWCYNLLLGDWTLKI